MNVLKFLLMTENAKNKTNGKQIILVQRENCLQKL